MKLKSSEQFVPGKNNIGYVSHNFKKNFGEMTFDETIPEFTTADLKEVMTSEQILDKLKPVELSLGDLLYALQNKKDMLENGCSNIFYIRDAKDELWAVDSRWSSYVREWSVRAYSVTDPVEWYVGYRVFSQVSSRPLGSLVAGQRLEKGQKVEIRDGEVFKKLEPQICKSCRRPL